jgi:hypothetical protein
VSSTEPIRLDDVASLPAMFASRLQAFDNLFQAHEHIDSVVADQRIRPLVDEIENYLRQLPIRAYHCTREPMPGYFAREGLRLTDVEVHQREFLSTFGNQFTETELQDMQTTWRDYFKGTGQILARNGRLWFCLTEATARSDGTEVFFKHFGGEAIFMPLKEHPTIAAKLGTIGSPVIVEVQLLPDVTPKYTSYARPLLSAYHLIRRPDASPWLSETYIGNPIAPKDILSVTPV